MLPTAIPMPMNWPLFLSTISTTLLTSVSAIFFQKNCIDQMSMPGAVEHILVVISQRPVKIGHKLSAEACREKKLKFLWAKNKWWVALPPPQQKKKREKFERKKNVSEWRHFLELRQDVSSQRVGQAAPTSGGSSGKRMRLLGS